MIVVDDWHLLSLLAGGSAELEALAADGVATTNSWLFRLSRAVRLGSGQDSISSAFFELPDDVQVAVQRTLDLLPEAVHVVHPRQLVPAMVAIASLRAGNLLTLEAVSTAAMTGGRLVVSTHSTLLSEIAASVDVEVVMVD